MNHYSSSVPPRRDMAAFRRRCCTMMALLFMSAHKFAISGPIPHCSVKIEHGKYTHYHVEMPQPPPKDCEGWSWNNGTDFVLANCKDMDRRSVLNSTNASLFTFECFEDIIFKLDSKQAIKVYCTANCTRTERQASENNSNKADRHHLCVAVVLCVSLVLAVVTVSVCLRNRRNGQRRFENPSEL